MMRTALRQQYLGSPLARRLIFAIVLASSAVTLCLTAFQLQEEYQDAMSGIDTSFRQVEAVHLGAMSQMLWDTNENGLGLQVAGIKHLPNVEFVSVREGDRVWALAGKRTSRSGIERQFPMSYAFTEQPLAIGMLTVSVGLDSIYHGLANRFVAVLAGNALKTFLVAAFALFLFQKLVTRHLQDMADYLRGLSPEGATPKLALNRPPGRKADELDDVCAAINRLGESLSRQRTLARQLLEVQETERRTIARELHDEVGGVLTVVKLSLQSLRAAGANEAPLADALLLVNGAIQTVRTISHDLRPAILDDLGLIPALKWYCERQVSRTGIAIETTLDAIDLESMPQVESACFRIVQESVTNALRHANARHIQVALRLRDDGFVLTVTDDGAGFDTATAHENALAGETTGLLGMEKRATLLGGSLGIDSVRDAGTRVRAEFLVPDFA